MAIAASSRANPAQTRGRIATRVGARSALVLIITASAVVRIICGWLRGTPTFFPDEYIYAELGRSIAETGEPLIRGGAAHFPALLQPVLTAPAWLLDDASAAFHLVQGVGALAMSLAAVPVFVLARMLGLRAPISLGIAALALALPQLLFASFLLAEPFAYPLVLAAIAAGVAALDRPSARAQLVFLGLAGLAAFARAQFVILPVCFILAAGICGLSRRQLWEALREQRLVLATVAVPLVAVAVTGPARALGYYEGVLGLDVDAAAIASWAGINLVVLLYASGWILVPGALLGLILALARPRSRVELAFAALVVPTSAALLLQAGLYAANGSERVQERYVFYLIPLLALCFGVYVNRSCPWRRAHALSAAALLALAPAVPLSAFTAALGRTDSPFLRAAWELERALGSPAAGSLAVATLAGLLAAAALLAGLRPRQGAPAALVLAIAACSASSVGAVINARRDADAVRAMLPANPAWVDRAVAGKTTLLAGAGNVRGRDLEHLFWNRSLRRVVRLPGADPVDGFAAPALAISAAGSLSVQGQRVGGALVVDGSGSTVRFRRGRVLAEHGSFTLFQPSGPAQLALYASGRGSDGWLAPTGSITLWPTAGGTLAGRLSMTLKAPPERAAPIVGVKAPGARELRLRLAPGAPTKLSVSVCSSGPWSLSFAADRYLLVDGRFVSVRATVPRFVSDPGACARASRDEGSAPIDLT